MAKFKIQRKLYNEVVQQEEYQPMSGTGQELRSAAISTLAPMAITGAVNAFSGASKGTKATLLGGALTAGLGYAAHKGYLGTGAQNLTNRVIGYGKSLVDRVKAIPQKAAAQNQQPVNQPAQPVQQVNPAGNFDPKTGKPTSTGYKNYKDLSPEAQARIQQENAAKKQQKQQLKDQRRQAAAQGGQQGKQPGKTVTIKRKTAQPANVGQK